MTCLNSLPTSLFFPFLLVFTVLMSEEQLMVPHGITLLAAITCWLTQSYHNLRRHAASGWCHSHRSKAYLWPQSQRKEGELLQGEQRIEHESTENKHTEDERTADKRRIAQGGQAHIGRAHGGRAPRESRHDSWLCPFWIQPTYEHTESHSSSP